RKGKVPRPIFEQRFGVESLYQDAVDIILPTVYSEAVEQTEIFPVDQPSIDIEEIERGKDLVFVCEVTVKPEVTLGDYKGVENEVKALQESNAELVVKEEGTVENGDTAVIDFEGFLGDEPFEGGKGENHPLEIGSGQFIPGFEEELLGKEAGETEVSVTFPED